VSTSAPTSVIHDIGYKPYTGPRQGHRQIVRGLFVHSLRSIFGFGRGPRAKVVPFAVLAIMLFPAILNVYAASKNEALIMPYSLLAYRLFLFSVLFVAVAAPELVSRDLRHHTLPLYFSRPLRRSDYPLAKLLALITAMLIVQLLPILVSYLGQVASATSGHEIWLDTRDAFPGVYVGVLYAVLFSTVSLLLASSTGRRVIATGIIAIFFLVTTAISNVLQNAVGTTWQNHTVSCVVPTLTKAQAQADTGPVFGGDSGPGNGPGGGPVGVGNGPGDGSSLLVGQLCPGVSNNLDNIENLSISPAPGRAGYADLSLGYQTPVYSMVAKAGGMTDPVSIVEGTRIWVFHATDSDIPNPSPLGPAYVAEFAVLALATGGGLFLRYRKVSVS
jgi:ABC-2 type transport system permease protein